MDLSRRSGGPPELKPVWEDNELPFFSIHRWVLEKDYLHLGGEDKLGDHPHRSSPRTPTHSTHYRNTRREALQTLATNGAQPADKSPPSRQPTFDRNTHSIVRPWTAYDESCTNSDEKGHWDATDGFEGPAGTGASRQECDWW